MGCISWWCFGVDFEEERETAFVGWVRAVSRGGALVMVVKKEKTVKASGYLFTSNNQDFRFYYGYIMMFNEL